MCIYDFVVRKNDGVKPKKIQPESPLVSRDIKKLPTVIIFIKKKLDIFATSLAGIRAR